MKKTNYIVCVAIKNGYPIYRTIYFDGNHYFVKYNGVLYNVDKDIENRTYTLK